MPDPVAIPRTTAAAEADGGADRRGAVEKLAFDEAMCREAELLSGLARDAARQRRPQSRFLLWQTPTALIVPSGMSRREGFAAAAAASARRGWPVHERTTGGDITPQFDGMLSLSLAFVLEGSDRTVENAYRQLATPLLDLLRDAFGIEAGLGAVAGAFCDGAYNIVVDRRKLAGTAQRWRLVERGAEVGPPATVVLGHIALLCGDGLDAGIDAINGFYRDCAMERSVERGPHVTLAALIGGPDRAEPGLVASRLAARLDAEGACRASG